MLELQFVIERLGSPSKLNLGHNLCEEISGIRWSRNLQQIDLISLPNLLDPAKAYI